MRVALYARLSYMRVFTVFPHFALLCRNLSWQLQSTVLFTQFQLQTLIAKSCPKTDARARYLTLTTLFIHKQFQTDG